MEEKSQIIKRLRKIEFSALRLVEEQLAGSYHSVFKGKGIEFSEVREYQYGDEVRFIDWNVTAKRGIPHTKVFVEEREITVHVLIDMSSSLLFGSLKSKRDVAADIAAVLAFSAAMNQDKVGSLLFTDTIEKYVPPKKGRKQVMRIITDILTYQPKGKKTDIGAALEYLLKIYPKRGIVFLISDFLEPDIDKLINPILFTRKKNDLVGIRIKDPLEENLPDGLYSFKDLETGEDVVVDLNPHTRKQINEWKRKIDNNINEISRKTRMDFIEINTSEDFMPPILKFFQKRKKRVKR